MALFLSTFVNKIDGKGRVSVPASFRAALGEEAVRGIVLFRSQAHKCLEGVAWSVMKDLGDRLDNFDFLSDSQDDLATAIFGEAVQCSIDGDGRVSLPDELISYAGLEDRAAFVGMGRKFQIWAPDTFEARKETARRNIQEKGLTLPKGGAS